MAASNASETSIFQVVKVMPGSPAYGKSVTSDVLHEVNGTSVVGMSHDDMIALVKQADLTLTLSVERLSAAAKKTWQETDLSYADAIDTLEAHAATAETSFPSEAPDTAAEVEFLSKVAEVETAAPTEIEAAAPSYDAVTATETADDDAGYLQVGSDPVLAVTVAAVAVPDDEARNLSSFGVAEETEAADTSSNLSTFGVN